MKLQITIEVSECSANQTSRIEEFAKEFAATLSQRISIGGATVKSLEEIPADGISKPKSKATKPQRSQREQKRSYGGNV
jgi:hypothetical protein